MARIQTAVIHGLGSFPGDYTVLAEQGITVSQGLVFGRIDNESGNVPVPIPLAAPTTSYSWYKALTLIIPTGGTGATSIGSVAIRKTTIEPAGINLFYRVVPAYRQNNGAYGPVVDNAGNSTGNFPANDLTPHSGSSANTPLGYLPIPTSPVIIASATYPTSSVGPLGPIVQVVCGVSDRKAMQQSAGTLVLPQVEFTFDEF